jgi:hypothetical protein
VIREDRTARRRVAAHAATFDNAFPQRVPEIRRWLARPDASRPLAGLWFLTGDSQAVASSAFDARSVVPSALSVRIPDMRPPGYRVTMIRRLMIV